MIFNKINHKISALFLSVIVVSVVAVGWFSFQTTEQAVVSNALQQMHHTLGNKRHRVEMFHSRTKQVIRIALENPVFKEYFSLINSQGGKRLSLHFIILKCLSPNSRRFLIMRLSMIPATLILYFLIEIMRIGGVVDNWFGTFCPVF